MHFSQEMHIRIANNFQNKLTNLTYLVRLNNRLYEIVTVVDVNHVAKFFVSLYLKHIGEL